MAINEQGVNNDRYQVVPRLLIFIFNEDKHEVLLLKRSKTKQLWSSFYNGIGGHIDSGEDVLTAAERELFEETGIRNSELLLCGTITIDVEPQTGVILFLFRGAYNGQKLLESHEGKLKWVKYRKIKILKSLPDLPFLVKRCKDWQNGDPVFHLHSFYKINELVISDHHTSS